MMAVKVMKMIFKKLVSKSEDYQYGFAYGVLAGVFVAVAPYLLMMVFNVLTL
jgi:hypothetical protein